MLNIGGFCNDVIANIWIMLQLKFCFNFPAFWERDL